MDAEKSRMFEAIFNQINFPITVLEANAPQFIIAAMNDERRNAPGTPRDAVGRDAFDVYKPWDDNSAEQINLLKQGLSEVIKTGLPVKLPLLHFEFPGPSGELSHAWVQNEINPIFDAAGKVEYLLSVARNVTEAELGRLALERSRDEEKRLINELASANENLRSANEELAATNEEMGASNEELSAALEEINAASEEMEAVNGELMQSQQRLYELTDELEERVTLRTGEAAAANKELAAINSELTDINEELAVANEELALLNQQLFTSRVDAEQAELMLRLAIEAANFGTWHIDVKTREFLTSPRLKELFGFYPDEKMSFSDAVARITDDHRDRVAEAVEKAIAGGGNYDLSYTINGLHDHKKRWVRAVGHLQADEAGDYSTFTGVVMDITDQVKSNQAIKESEERFRAMAEGTDVLIAVSDEHYKAVYFNNAWVQLTGLTMAELTERWQEVLHPDDAAHAMSVYRSAFERGASFKDGYRVRSNDKTYRYLLVNARARYYADGSFAGYVSSSADITELKQEEQRKNDFIGVVSHELKTPLTTMKAYIQMLQGKARQNDDSFTLNALDRANKQIGKMTTLINGFLNVARLESGKILIDKQRFDMAQLVKEIEEETAVTISSHNVVFAPVKETFIFADREKIGQVINNLVSNAVKYSPLGSTVNVACVKVSRMVQVSVSDQGMGIMKQDMERLFDRFYRVEGVQNQTVSGFGIGLYLCAEIIQRHDGRIWVDSEIGRGSQFYFNLPPAK